MIAVQMVIGLVGVAILGVIFCIIALLLIQLGRFAGGEKNVYMYDDTHYFIDGIITVVLIVFAMAIVLVGAYNIGDVVMTALGLKG